MLVLAVLAVVGVWRLFRHASEAARAAALTAQEVQDLARRVGPGGGLGMAAPPADVYELRAELTRLADEQRRLQELARSLLDAASQAGPPTALGEVESAVTRLDATVGQMATSLANLIQLLQRQARQ